MFEQGLSRLSLSDEKNISSEPLLDEGGNVHGLWAKQDTSHARKHSRCRSLLLATAKYLLATATGLMILILVFPEAVVQLTQKMSLRPLSVPSAWSPLDSKSIRWETLPADPEYTASKLYMGEPSYAGDRAWNKIIHPHGTRVSEYEKQRLNIEETIPLASGGYATILGVYHNLHCLRRIHQYYFQDYYYPNVTAEVFERWREHDLHCLEVLRRSVMCHPDLSVNPYYPSGNPDHAINVGTDVSRECVDWELLETATVPRKYPKSEYPPGLFPS